MHTIHPKNQEFLDHINTLKKEIIKPKHWVYVPYDQLSLQLNPEWLLLPPQEKPGLILIESNHWYRYKPFHQQRIALLSANQRFFAIEALFHGFWVDYTIDDMSISEILQQRIKHHQCQKVAVRTPAEYILRMALKDLLDQGLLVEIKHNGFLSDQNDFINACGHQAPWRMDAFYRYMRKKLNLFVTPQGKALHGKWSMDTENRLPWKGQVSAPILLVFDEAHWIKVGVKSWIEDEYADHPGQVKWHLLPCSMEECEQLWTWAKTHCLPYFGPYEDAMHDVEKSLFHTRISGILNLHRLLPMQIVQDCLQLNHIPYASLEGFIRQIIGWREFVFQVHWYTQGFRDLPKHINRSKIDITDAGWYAYQPTRDVITKQEGDLSDANFLNAQNDLPAVFWGERSVFSCLNHVTKQVMDEGWSHHITRLMVLSNWATLLEVSPRLLTDWFWISYIDAFDWVVEPNVLGMSTFALGDMMTTKPYVSGASYISKMSNYCESCELDPKTTCVMTRLYWRFMKKNQAILASNPRMSIALSGLKKRALAEQELDEEAYQWTLNQLGMKGLIHKD